MGDIVLACTDGLTDALTDDEITAVIAACAARENGCEELPVCLVDAALDAGTTDNVTVLSCLYKPSTCLNASIPAETLTGTYPAALAKVLFPVKEVEHV